MLTHAVWYFDKRFTNFVVGQWRLNIQQPAGPAVDSSIVISYFDKTSRTDDFTEFYSIGYMFDRFDHFLHKLN